MDVGGGGPEDSYGLEQASASPIVEFSASDACTESGKEAVTSIMRRDGVVCIRDVFSQDQLVKLRSAYHDCWELTKARVTDPELSTCWQRRIYTRMGGPGGSKTAALDKGLYHRVPFKITDEEGSMLIRMGRGRYDFDFRLSETVCGTDELLRPEPVYNVLSHFLGHDSEFRSYPGGLPAEGPCGPGRWHRDIFSLWEEEGIEDAALPPFYFTVISPLTDVGADDGPTQFRLGSHLLPAKQVASAPFSSVHLCAGDLVMFDGRIVHRGGPRKSIAGARHALYSVHHKWWYNDDDMVPPVTRIEDLKPEEVAAMEVEEPWLKVGKKHSHGKILSKAISLQTSIATNVLFWQAATLVLGLSLGTALGFGVRGRQIAVTR